MGLTLDVASHGIGTAGTFAGVGMALSTLAASLLVPVLMRWLM